MKEKDWDKIIKPAHGIFSLRFKELIAYRDLLFLFVKRDLISLYKQTILGPAWFVIQPIITALMYLFIFGGIAKIDTGLIPPFLFYLSGVSLWNFFSECLIKTSDTFGTNAALFGKVYFPRLIVPVSVVMSNFLKFTITFFIFFIVLIYYMQYNSHLLINEYALLFPLIILTTALIGLGIGMIISSLTTKYKDLKFLVQFAVQLLMFASPIIYPLSSATGKLKTVLLLNPMSSLIESFKFGFTGIGYFSWLALAYSICCGFFLFLIGVIIFNRVERNFMDTI